MNRAQRGRGLIASTAEQLKLENFWNNWNLKLENLELETWNLALLTGLGVGGDVIASTAEQLKLGNHFTVWMMVMLILLMILQNGLGVWWVWDSGVLKNTSVIFKNCQRHNEPIRVEWSCQHKCLPNYNKPYRRSPKKWKILNTFALRGEEEEEEEGGGLAYHLAFFGLMGKMLGGLVWSGWIPLRLLLSSCCWAVSYHSAITNAFHDHDINF